MGATADSCSQGQSAVGSLKALSPDAPSLSDFLRSTKDFSLDPSKPCHLVLGNPAGDADSIISAIGLAYIKHLEQISEKDPSTHVLPIVSIPERQLRTQRPETTYLLELAGVSVTKSSDADQGNSMLTCIDHISEEICGDDRFSVSLVDHNRIDASPLNFKWTVTEILDHHFDERQHIESCSEERRSIAFDQDQALVASTCTLVAERYRSMFHSAMPPSLSMLLLGVVLLDSVNMSPKAGKGTDRDRVAIDALIHETDWTQIHEADVSSKEEHTEGDDLTRNIWKTIDSDKDEPGRIVPDPDKFFEALQAQKFDPKFWAGLSATDAITLDYKSFSIEPDTGTEDDPKSFGVATILITLDDFFSKPDAIKEIADYMKDQNISILGIMSAVSSNGQLKRELSIVGTEIEEWRAMLEYLDGSVPLELSELRPSTMDKDRDIFIFYALQGNPKSSRKQVAPIMMDFWKQSDDGTA